ncbi:hypothetical protein GUITHDRAFT_119151 [Guillardia theta CCMP2712]|uniref:Methyltransferase FkbM domain-containing protein n=1 Tax=Guillardia theta (strain CCMP2712) TaxID=905079 RepID=L1IF63_GUITC|nr:hypothetical protein GUITHDRAFT_119151 [Guillardia theta CCMP2712]EKX34717.1 hypothetical protein GUITHDRAFT_119151 [Guillardia theta CCMP2712]|eukprot:XP_005821697.1 hypothetical protein GUITHDRAFT_119151 [Guillardia theta CCMP2712]
MALGMGTTIEEEGRDVDVDAWKQKIAMVNGSRCFVEIIQPNDSPWLPTLFFLGDDLDFRFRVSCDVDGSKKDPPSSQQPVEPSHHLLGVSGTLFIDGDPMANFSFSRPFEENPWLDRTISFEITQWYETNIVIERKTSSSVHTQEPTSEQCQKDVDEGTWEMKYLLSSRTLSIGNKHIAQLQEDGATLLYPSYGQRVVEGEPVEVQMALNRQTFTSTSLSVKVVVGLERSFQASPELKLPALGSPDKALLQVTVAYLPKAGLLPFRVEVETLQDGIIAVVRSFVKVVAKQDIQGGQEQDRTETGPEGLRTIDTTTHLVPEVDTSMFCSRKDSFNVGHTLDDWHKQRGDETFRILSYRDQLDEHSIVVDVGAHAGDWSSSIFTRFRCQVHAFEPLPRHAAMFEERTQHVRPRVQLHRKAISTKGGRMKMLDKGVGSHLLSEGSQVEEEEEEEEEMRVLSVDSLFDELDVRRVDLLKFNVEGEEFDLLARLLDLNMMDRIRNLQVQFHHGLTRADELRQLRARLNETHCLTFWFSSAWENWRSR